jgi:hypothetical protein
VATTTALKRDSFGRSDRRRLATTGARLLKQLNKCLMNVDFKRALHAQPIGLDRLYFVQHINTNCMKHARASFSNPIAAVRCSIEVYALLRDDQRSY